MVFFGQPVYQVYNPLGFKTGRIIHVLQTTKNKHSVVVRCRASKKVSEKSFVHIFLKSFDYVDENKYTVRCNKENNSLQYCLLLSLYLNTVNEPPCIG